MNAQKVLEQARALVARNKHGEAADFIYENAEGHNNPSLHFLEGECFVKLDDLQTAVECFKNAYLSTQSIF